MLINHFIVSTLSSALMILSVGNASAQAYPSKPIRIVTVGVGTTNDFISRLIAQGVTETLGQQVIVENRPGSAIISGQAVAKAAPDGYTLLFGAGAIWMVTLLQKDVPYDPVKDFSPISLVTKGTNVLVVHPSLPVKSVKELIALAKARPGQLNFSTGATGGSTHLAPELFKAMAGVDMVRVIYTSGAVETGDLLSGQVQLTFGSGSLMPHVKTGRLRALAVTSAQPSALFPNIPTIASTVPGYESVGIFGILAPPQTPAAIVNRLNQEIVRVINRPETKERLLGVDQEVIGSSPEQYAATIKDELTKWTKVFKDAGIKPQ